MQRRAVLRDDGPAVTHVAGIATERFHHQRDPSLVIHNEVQHDLVEVWAMIPAVSPRSAGRRCPAPHGRLALARAVNRQCSPEAREPTRSLLREQGGHPTSTALRWVGGRGDPTRLDRRSRSQGPGGSCARQAKPAGGGSMAPAMHRSRCPDPGPGSLDHRRRGA